MRLIEPECLLREQIGDLYSAETQLILALPRVAMRVESSELRQAIQTHLDQTREHAERLERIADALEFSCGGYKCIGMQGILKQGDLVMGYGGNPNLVDTAIITASQQIEHFEIAAYRGACKLAKQAGLEDAVVLLESTLSEEEEADRLLGKISDSLLADLPMHDVQLSRR